MTPRTALTAALTCAVLAGAPDAAQAQLTATAPADGATATQGTMMTFTGTGGGFLTDVKISRSAAVGADGSFTGPAETATSFASGDAWSVYWTPTGGGSFYWQAQRTDCSVSPCATLRTAPRLLTVTYAPEAIRPAPTLNSPKMGSNVTLGKAVQLSASDINAETMTFEASTDPQTNADGTFANPAFSKAAGRYTGSIGYRPAAAGTHYWHAIRTGCRPFDSVFVGTKLLETDCVSRRVSETRTMIVSTPAPKLRLSASGRAYRRGDFGFSVVCANPPCRVQVTGTFADGLPTLRASLQVPKSKRAYGSLRPTKRQQRRIAAAVARRGKLRLRLRAQSTDRYQQTAADSRRITLSKPKPPKPPKPVDPEQRAAERAVVRSVAGRYEIGEDRAWADCRRSNGRVEWRCDWSTDTIYEFGQYCVYSGEADASRISGDWWDVRVYDIGATCYD